MEKIKIISDSTCDLSAELLKKHDIDIVPLYVSFKEESYRDLVDINTDQMYQLVEKHGILPKTSAASPGDFHDVFKKHLDLGYKIIYTGIGSKFSATFTSANLAKEMLESEDIYLIDSQNLSSGTGLLLLKASSYRHIGMSAANIAKELETLVPKVRSQFVIDTLEYLYKGGRVSALSALMGGMLKIKPIIKVRDGMMVVGKKARGLISKGIDMMIEEFMAVPEEVDDEYLMITHSKADKSANYIKEKLNGKTKIRNIYETDAGCVISSHCGKGTIGILYITK